LSEIERGRKDPSSEIIAAIAPVLDLALADVVARATRELASAESAIAGRSPVRERAAAASVPDLAPVVDLTAIAQVAQVAEVVEIAPAASPAEPQLLAA
jgi:transcriptional regulator with XRE-family HTH domain